MSADSWGVCPKCGTDEERKDGCGQLREDYEVGIIDGEFYLRYSAVCRRGPGKWEGCGFKYEKNIDEKVNPNNPIHEE